MVAVRHLLVFVYYFAPVEPISQKSEQDRVEGIDENISYESRPNPISSSSVSSGFGGVSILEADF